MKQSSNLTIILIVIRNFHTFDKFMLNDGVNMIDIKIIFKFYS